MQQKQFSEKVKITTFGIVYYNALIAAPLTAICLLLNGELGKFANYPRLGETGFWVGFIVSCFMGLLLTYSSMLSTTYNSPLATSITGNAKDVLTTAIGWAVFSGFLATAKSVGGILLSFFGAFMYSYVNLQRAKAREASAKADAAAAALKSAAIAPLGSGNGGEGGDAVSNGSNTHSHDLERGAGEGVALLNGTSSSSSSTGGVGGSEDDGVTGEVAAVRRREQA